jgi:predicted RNA-binding Zn ribbon-like protein
MMTQTSNLTRVTDRTAPKALVLVQELANTLDIGAGTDTLAASGGVAEFAQRLGLGRLGLRRGDLDGLRGLREALRAACLAHTGTDMSPEAADELRGLLARAPLVVAVDERGRARLRPGEGLPGLASFTARVAAGIAAGAADGSWQRLKACEAPDCRWVFYDRSPAVRGRWCTMAVCGSRAKMRAYRSRGRGPA